MKIISVLKYYFKSRRILLLLLPILFSLLYMVCSLSGYPLSPVFYASLLMVFFIFSFGIFDFYCYLKELRHLENLKKMASVHVETLPLPYDGKNRYINEIINMLEHRCEQAELEFRRSETATREYYTLWSHQAKTPLAAMRLLLQETSPSTEDLRQELFKAEQYVDMALQYQRLKTSPCDLLFKEHDVESIVKQSVKQTSTLFIHKKIAIKFGSLDGSVLTDRKWLVFVLEQLLGNAVKYTPFGSVTVYFQDCKLYIRDTGIGISPEDLPRVFEWGYTGYNGHGETRSTGIGLALCRATLTMLGHKISIDSQMGKGTTVILDLSRDEFHMQ